MSRTDNSILEEIAANTNAMRYVIENMNKMIHNLGIDHNRKDYEKACNTAMRQLGCQHIIGTEKNNRIVFNTDVNAWPRIYTTFEFCPKCGIAIKELPMSLCKREVGK